MPYPNENLWRCNINSNLLGGEECVNTVWIRKDAGSVATINTQDVANRVRDAWAGFLAGNAARNTIPQAGSFSTETVFSNVTAYKVSVLGLATEIAVAPFAATAKGTSSATAPLQLALVVTLLTDNVTRSGRGRLFLGGLSLDLIGAGARLTALSRDRMATSMGEFYKQIRDDNADPDDIRAVVVSPTKGQSFVIRRVTVGDVLDTMRSRRKGIQEVRSAYAVEA